MTEERLKEIKDSIDYQDEVKFYENDYDMLVDLYNEVIRLREENKKKDYIWYKNQYDRLLREKCRFEHRIDKAIEYIENYCIGNLQYENKTHKVLLNILRGNNK